MELVTTIRKEVTDYDEGEALFTTIKTQLAELPDLRVLGMINDHFPKTPENDQ